MAPRRPRSNPAPPNRSRSRSRARVPAVSTFYPDPKATGLAYSKIVLGNGQPAAATPKVEAAPNFASAEAARAAASLNTSMELMEAIEEARQGNDLALLPYQPTPSINPPRPRTLAAGYDKETQTLRIRFREGAGYVYYNVTPQEWRNFRRVKSPGRYINRVLNYKPYEPQDF